MATVAEIAKEQGWTLLAGKEGIDREVEGCYAGDLLSWVMGRAKEGDLWLTVMGNVNAIAVATLADVSGVVLTESAALDEDAAQRAEQRGIPVYRTSGDTYETALAVSRYL
jgi:predicted transcriptional regulator